MTTRVGIDLVSVDAVASAVHTHEQRYLDRVYTKREQADCMTGTGISLQRLAARFAAKEATLKVLRAGDVGIPLTDIEVVRDPAGWVDLVLAGPAAASAAEADICDLAVSLTHEQGFASAVVVAQVERSLSR